MSMKVAYKTSAKVFEQVSKRNNPGLPSDLKSLRKNEIIVVKGQHDHVEKIIDAIGIPYTLMKRENNYSENNNDNTSTRKNLDKQLKNYEGSRVLFVNCASYEDNIPAESVREFVKRGGRLVTTDWALDFAAKAFPGHLFKREETTDDVVEIKCFTPLAQKLIGLHYSECHPKWWLEGSSYLYQISTDTIPIITSPEMKERYGQDCVAAGFMHGRGEVLHFISHFELQRTHQRTSMDRGDLEEFLKNMSASRTKEMAGVSVAELEAAYSTINTVAHLCARAPLLNPASYGTKSVLKKA